MHPAEHIMELVRQVRPLTIKWVAKPEDRHLLWAPEGLCNHVLWHAGHILWVNEVLGVRMLGGKGTVPPDWEQTFGQNCRPVRETRQWPARQQVISLLEAQMQEMLRLLASADEATLSRKLQPDSDATVASRVLHGIHDEAKHQGEIHLLIKQWRAQNNWQPPVAAAK